MLEKPKLIYRGAEAEIWEDSYLGEKVILKKRIRKPYKARPLDESLRSHRTKNEARLLCAARDAVRTPHVYELGRTELKMEGVEGNTLKNLFLQGKTSKAKQLGRDIRRLHDADIIHNDLTTSNMLLKDGEIYFIDFGLGEVSDELEDKATDLLVFKKMLASTHYQVFDEVWEEVLSGYRAAEKMRKRIEKIERRARYL